MMVKKIYLQKGMSWPCYITTYISNSGIFVHIHSTEAPFWLPHISKIASIWRLLSYWQGYRNMDDKAKR